MAFAQRNKIRPEGSMSSMTDLVFLLLIFFIIMSLMSNHNTKVDVPEDSDLPPIQDPTTATVIITENNGYVVEPGGDLNNPIFDFQEAVPLIESKVAEFGEGKLKIEGHKKADYESVFKAMALAQKSGWDPVLTYKK